MSAIQRIYVDQSHVRGHVTGIERVAIDLFAPEALAPHDVRVIRSKGLAGMVLTQQLLLPLRGLMDQTALFVFPGFPPGPLSVALGKRCLIYVHDTFLLTRPQDLNWKARTYMRSCFAWAMRHGNYFLVNSMTTELALRAVCSDTARIAVLRPQVKDVFGLAGMQFNAPWTPEMPLRFLAIGTIEPRKNYSASIEIIRALNDAGVPAELHIVGRVGWGQQPFLTDPPPFLKLHGYVADKELERVMKNCHFLLSTSNAEGLGLPLLEVQHGGLPVVAPKGEVFEEVLGDSALFIDPSDTVGAAEKILNLARDPKRLASAAIASRTNVDRWNKLAADDFNRFHRFLVKGITSFPTELAQTNLSGPARINTEVSVGSSIS